MGVEPRSPEGEKPFRVRRGRVDSVDLYEIKDGELDQLESGTPADLQLNFAIFVLSLAFSAIASLATATFQSEIVKTIFIVVMVVGILLGAFLLISWSRSRRSLRELCRRIRRRIPPETLVTPPPAATNVSNTDQPSG
jgi:hypothetical protein